jgi:hypothetical protein
VVFPCLLRGVPALSRLPHPVAASWRAKPSSEVDYSSNIEVGGNAGTRRKSYLE